MSNLSTYDKRGVRAFVRYSEGNGTWAIECWRKKTKKELQEEWEKLHIPIECNWKMKRVGWVITYLTRGEAERKALELAESICNEFGFKKNEFFIFQ